MAAIGVLGAGHGGVSAGAVLAYAAAMTLIGMLLLLTLDRRRRDAQGGRHARELRRLILGMREQMTRVDAETRGFAARMDSLAAGSALMERRISSRLESVALDGQDGIRRAVQRIDEMRGGDGVPGLAARMDSLAAGSALMERRISSRLESVALDGQDGIRRAVQRIDEVLCECKPLWDATALRSEMEAPARQLVDEALAAFVAELDQVEQRWRVDRVTMQQEHAAALSSAVERMREHSAAVLASVERAGAAHTELREEILALRALVRDQPSLRVAMQRGIERVESALAQEGRSDRPRNAVANLVPSAPVETKPVHGARLPADKTGSLASQAGDEVPVVRFGSWRDFAPDPGPVLSRYASALDNGVELDSLLLTSRSRVLLVALHGATNRVKYVLPRFEWLRTLSGTDYNALFISDPTLKSDSTLRLSWYTGWQDLDLRPILAELAQRAADVCGAEQIVFFGSSGGGFAAIQSASFLPGSLAVAFSPQSELSRYFEDGTGRGAQRKYVDCVMPHLAPEGYDALAAGTDWSEPLGERASLLRLFERPLDSKTLYVQNSEDHWHYQDHYLPLRERVPHGPNQENVRFSEYLGDPRHRPPRREQLLASIANGLRWLANDESGSLT